MLNFTPINDEQLDDVISKQKLKMSEHLLLMYLVRMHNEYDGEITASQKYLADKMHSTTKTISIALNSLQDLGLLTIVKRNNMANKQTDLYLLNFSNEEVSNTKSDLTKSYLTNSYPISYLITRYTNNTKTSNKDIKITKGLNHKTYKLKRGYLEMRQLNLFAGAPMRINKKVLTAKELFILGEKEEIKLTYGEFIKAYKFAHLEYYGKEAGGKMTHDEVGLTLQFLKDDYKLEGGQLLTTLKEFFSQLKETREELPHVSFYMIRKGKDFQELLVKISDKEKGLVNGMTPEQIEAERKIGEAYLEKYGGEVDTEQTVF